MYFYNSWHACSRISSRPSTFALLNERDPAEVASKESSHDENWNEKEEIKINTWAETFDLGSNSQKSDKTRNSFCSRLSPCSRKFIAKNIKSRLNNMVHTNCVDRTSSKDPGSRGFQFPFKLVTRKASRAKIYMTKVSQKMSPHRSDINYMYTESVSTGKEIHDEISSDRAIIDESEVCGTRRARKHRQVTRYYSQPRPGNHFPQRGLTTYHSAPTLTSIKSNGAHSEKISLHHRSHTCHKPIGRHLEWLKFLA